MKAFDFPFAAVGGFFAAALFLTGLRAFRSGYAGLTASQARRSGVLFMIGGVALAALTWALATGQFGSIALSNSF